MKEVDDEAREGEARIVAFFERVLDKVAAHPRYGAAVRGAIDAGRDLVLDYHTHGPQHGWCVSICCVGTGVPLLGLDAPLDELAHVRGVASEAEHCDPLMAIFGARVALRYGLAEPPRVYFNGKPRG